MIRLTRLEDLDIVIGLETDPDNQQYIGSWSVAKHAATIDRSDREHWIIEDDSTNEILGYLIVYDLTKEGNGVYVKRIAVTQKGTGIGRVAMQIFVAHAFDALGADFVWLAVRPDNERAQRSYRRVGFEIHAEMATNGNVLMVFRGARFIDADAVLARIGAGAADE